MTSHLAQLTSTWTGKAQELTQLAWNCQSLITSSFVSRQIARQKNTGKRVVFYHAPCALRLRNIDEVDIYLVMTNSQLTIDLFCYDSQLHTHTEYVPVKVFAFWIESLLLSGLTSKIAPTKMVLSIYSILVRHFVTSRTYPTARRLYLYRVSMASTGSIQTMWSIPTRGSPLKESTSIWIQTSWWDVIAKMDAG